MSLRWMVLLALAIVLAWGVASGFLARVMLAVEILDELRRPGPGSLLRRASAPPRVESLALESPERFAADLYRPARGGSRVPVMLVPGLVEQGKDDPRVAPFAELLARAGFTVVVPDLPSYRTLRAHPDNLRELAAAHDALTARADLAPRGRAGLFGISYAGGMAILGALDPARASRIPFVAVVGAYADLDTTLRFLATGRTLLRGRPRMVRTDPYGQLVFLRTFEEFLASAPDRALLEAIAARRLRDPAARIADLADSLGPEGRVIVDLFEGRDPDRVTELLGRLPAGLVERMGTLSPARHDFAALSARLYVVHALDDGTFPASEAIRLRDLARPRTRTHLVLLEALQHVEPRPWQRDPWAFATRDLPEAVRLAAWWVALLGER